jgi:hypothetical protein
VAVADGNSHAVSQKNGFDMGRHIIRSLIGMDVIGLVFRDSPVKEGFQIRPYWRIGVFIDRQRG